MQSDRDLADENATLRQELADANAMLDAVRAVLHKRTPAPAWVVPKSELREALGLPVPVRAARR